MIKIYLLVLLVIIFIIPTSSFVSHQLSDSKGKLNLNNIQALNQNVNSKEKLNPDNPEVKKYFFKVAQVPYKANYYSNKPKTPSKFWKDNSGDCDDKSVAFADYLYKRGVRDVKLVSLTYKTSEYGHECVMWEDHIFDATAEPPIYNMDQEEYHDFIENKGFKLWVDYLYEPVSDSTNI